MELTFPQIPTKIPTRDKKGRIIAGRGHVPANKGKKWSDFNISEENKKTLLENLKEGRILGTNSKKTYHRIKVVGIKNRKFYGVFDSATDAALCLQQKGINISHQNIRNCCKGHRPSAGGVKWFYESDFEKWNAEIKVAV